MASDENEKIERKEQATVPDKMTMTITGGIGDTTLITVVYVKRMQPIAPLADMIAIPPKTIKIEPIVFAAPNLSTFLIIRANPFQADLQKCSLVRAT